MAIHPSLPGMVANVVVDQNDLPEYDNEEVDELHPTACVRYIEAVSGARFHIAFSFDGDVFPYAESSVAVKVNLDCGTGSQKVWEPQDREGPARKFVNSAVHRTENGRVKQDMVFSELMISDKHAPDPRLIGKLAALGTIRVEIYKAILNQEGNSRRKGTADHSGRMSEAESK
ncbi:hypothetical protein LTR35_004251 [Friedmanniomyces endolithicus]|uniref:DUF7918 domain-containing protein n=1 Tax=Friedmanniomyces endolithicus TaxID=329885 RepID=A0AAN6FYC8_9PEZI|nr:hypothetical protein LTR35_004251 [Friedmanniomyces endolithicus]KAK0294487.1 hypothetical protein LTS00_007078 [Friedmanniomyces endolithicus]KAK0326660.1 hypothetical protein LTR82_002502 [Friedmanniomyces endolithicus]KAK1017612.1 hypothetical protein LTR54_002270 [Friedmanniomyces endolithicus]